MSQQHHNPSNFWFGFSLGTIMGVAGVYLFGTEQGRKNLHKALELTENLEETVEKAMGGVGEEYIDGLAGSETVGRDKGAEAGSVVEEKESLLQTLLKTVIDFAARSQTKTHNFEVRNGKVVH
ncbi:MAG: hypothetical protein WAT72_04460 [Microgenomates group bacterium]|nr:hypothetical protein [Candidatus Woesebacteria bacterium]MBP6883515.1 hypothetical protein [Candidatus Woesebacteria bacterium]QQR63708.1 MAG: hypothetical protein IPH70_04370 [Candidatus Roizmanbacteria bacterium]